MKLKSPLGLQFWFLPNVAKFSCLLLDSNVAKPSKILYLSRLVSRKSRELFGPEKPFVKLRLAYSAKLVFSYVVKGIKIKITSKFRASSRHRFEDTKRNMSPEIRPKSFGTFEKQAPGTVYDWRTKQQMIQYTLTQMCTLTQMTVESNYVIAIATLNDWLKRLAPVFQPMRSKTKTYRAMYA